MQFCCLMGICTFVFLFLLLFFLSCACAILVCLWYVSHVSITTILLEIIYIWFLSCLFVAITASTIIQFPCIIFYSSFGRVSRQLCGENSKICLCSLGWRNCPIHKEGQVWCGAWKCSGALSGKIYVMLHCTVLYVYFFFMKWNWDT